MLVPFEVAMILVDAIGLEVIGLEGAVALFELIKQNLQTLAHPRGRALSRCSHTLLAQDLGNFVEVDVKVVSQELADVSVFTVAIEAGGAAGAVDVNLVYMSGGVSWRSEGVYLRRRQSDRGCSSRFGRAGRSCRQ